MAETSKISQNTSQTRTPRTPAVSAAPALVVQSAPLATLIQRAVEDAASLSPGEIALLQRTVGNRELGRLTGRHRPASPNDQDISDLSHRPHRALAQSIIQARALADARDPFFRKPPPSPVAPQSVQRQPQTEQVIQRTLDPTRLNRLKQGLGQNKFAKVRAAGQEEYFDKLTDDQLDRYKRMQNDQFVILVNGLKENLLTSLAGKTATIGQIADLLGAAVETGEEASTIVKMMPSILGSLSGMVSAGVDTGMEGFGGGIGGIKDTIEGGSSVIKQQKYLEGGLTTLGGLSGIASLIPGVPDFVGMAGAGAKSVAGITKLANTRINQVAINRLRSDGSANPALTEALDVLEEKLDHWAYIEGAMQTGLGAVEGIGAMYGSVTKWMAGAISKGTETAYNWLPYLGRAVGSYTGLVDSNTTVKEREETGKAEGKKKMWAAVESVESGGLPEHIGRLHRLAVLIDPDYADEISRAVGTLRRDLRESVEKAIKLKATWNPS
jgi:hypothetical protein